MPQDALGRRVLAALLDLAVLFVVFLVLANVLGDAEVEGASGRAYLDGAGAALFFALVLAYYVGFEALTGQTPGKRLLGVRVVDAETGGRPGAGRVVVRTLLRVVDGLPFLYLVGLMSVLLTGERRARLGDLAARTRVDRA